MSQDSTRFPEPTLADLAQSEQLMVLMKQEITLRGPMSFVNFMQRALYTPLLGYYTGSQQKFGKEGDFITAPEMSALYSQCVAVQCQQILATCPGDILECGAGTGMMAAEILKFLALNNSLPAHYYILEISPTLRARQEATLRAHVPCLLEKVVWLDSLSHLKFKGLILGNEILDAFPVHRFKYVDGKLQELFVTVKNDELAWLLADPSTHLKQTIEGFDINFQEGYESECNLYLIDWIKNLAEILEEGAVLLMDYGFPRHEYYHPDRSQGTLMCHYRHMAHQDPLRFIGLQDITAHVDFTLVAEAGEHASFSLAGFTNQASFLLSCGIIDLLQKQPKENYLQLTNEIKVLTSPNEMGEFFKIIALTKNIHIPLIGFSLRNNSDRL